MSTIVRTKIRCPNCQKDGKARAEVLNHRVICKGCQHIFRAVEVGDSTVSRSRTLRPMAGSVPIPVQAPSGDRLGVLEGEVRRLREALSSGRDLAGQVHLLRDRLARSTSELIEARQAVEALRIDRDRLAAELVALRSGGSSGLDEFEGTEWPALAEKDSDEAEQFV